MARNDADGSTVAAGHRPSVREGSIPAIRRVLNERLHGDEAADLPRPVYATAAGAVPPGVPVPDPNNWMWNNRSLSALNYAYGPHRWCTASSGTAARSAARRHGRDSTSRMEVSVCLVAARLAGHQHADVAGA